MVLAAAESTSETLQPRDVHRMSTIFGGQSLRRIATVDRLLCLTFSKLRFTDGLWSLRRMDCGALDVLFVQTGPYWTVDVDLCLCLVHHHRTCRRRAKAVCVSFLCITRVFDHLFAKSTCVMYFVSCRFRDLVRPCLLFSPFCVGQCRHWSRHVLSTRP